MNKIFLSVLLLLPALFPVQGQSWRALQQQAQKRGELASARQIILLDSTAVSVAPSGTGTFTINKVILVQNRSGALANRVLKYDYDPLTAFAEFHRVNIYKANGEVRPVDVGKTLDYTAPARMIYWGARQIMLELGRLDPGDIIEYEIHKKGFTYALLTINRTKNGSFLLCGDNFMILFLSGVTTRPCARYIPLLSPGRKRCNSNSTKANVLLLCVMKTIVKSILLPKII